MKKYIKLAAGLLGGIVALAGFTACEDDYKVPQIDTPVASLTPNATILEIKEAFWDDATNYIWGTDNVETATPVSIPAREDGSHYIIHGRVISSDEAGNVFKSLIIQDETGALAMSINSYNLYLNHRVGQELVIDLTGMYIGKYNGLLQLGSPEWYANGNAWEASFMSSEFFQTHRQLNGWPEIEKVDTITVNAFSELSTDPAGLRKWQSQLVRFNNVEFVNGGKETFSTYHSSGVNQSITDAEGNSMIVRTSGYSNFWNKTLPQGKFDLVCIASYYGTTGWQLILIDEDGCMNVGNPTLAPGSETNPWSIEQAIAEINAGNTPSGWVTGYIVGAVAPEVTSVTQNSDIEWTANPVLGNTIVIGATADTKDIANALVMELPYGSKLYAAASLTENPEVYGKQIWIRGTLDKYLDTYGLTGNNGTVGTWTIDGITTDDEGIKDGDGQKDTPYSANQVVAGTGSGTTAWVIGYIVGSSPGKNASDFIAGADGASGTNIFIANTPDQTDYTKCVPVQLPVGDVRTQLNLQNNPGNLGKKVSVYGSLEKYFTLAGVKSVTEFVLEGGSTPSTPTTPQTVTTLNEDFETGALPTGWTSYKLKGDKAWYFPEFSGNHYAAMTGYKGTAPFDSWLVTPGLDLANMSSKTLTFDTQVNGYNSTTTNFEVYVLTDADPAKATKTKLNPTLAVAPSSAYSDWVESGNIDLSSYSGVVYIGFCYTATTDENYATWCVDNVKINAAGGEDPTPDDPSTPPTTTDDYKGNFNSFNNGEAKSNPYSTYTNATGWTATNAIILGGTEDSNAGNPYFTFIGATGTLAPTLNGKTGSAGTLTSPLLTDGIKTLTFSYGFAFTESKCSFTINIKDANGNVVKTDTVTLETITKQQAYSYSLDVNYTGNFTIEIVNNCLTNSTANKDRVSIWNLTWN